MTSSIERKPSDYELGKTQKSVEHGVLYSNGKVVWERDLFDSLNTPAKREAFLKKYQETVESLNVSVEREIMFVKRNVTTKYGTLIPIAD